jgi:hypothetical protein
MERRGVVVAAAVDISTEEGEEGEEQETGEVCCFSLREDNRGELSDHGLLKPDISQICCNYKDFVFILWRSSKSNLLFCLSYLF